MRPLDIWNVVCLASTASCLHKDAFSDQGVCFRAWQAVHGPLFQQGRPSGEHDLAIVFDYPHLHAGLLWQNLTLCMSNMLSEALDTCMPGIPIQQLRSSTSEQLTPHLWTETIADEHQRLTKPGLLCSRLVCNGR
jgi:hypothetical protein